MIDMLVEFEAYALVKEMKSKLRDSTSVIGRIHKYEADGFPEESLEWFQDYVQISNSSANAITGVAYHDAAYIINSVNKLQRQRDVSSIVIVSHTVPAPWIIEHDIDLADNVRFNTMGNFHIQRALDEDTENKVKAWCFGHYHKSVDRDFGGVRYVSNPRGRGDTPWSQNPYFPKRIEITI
jgi:hypothetical protein